MLSTDMKIRIQIFGRFLSNMVMPNIGAFIAWGIITAFFIPTGWFPNPEMAKLVSPMITYLLPLLIGYSGGRLVAGERGGVVGAITTIGVIVGTNNPMFIGAMLAGPMGGYAIKRFDHLVEGKIKSGFEMLVNNFSAGIIGTLLTLLAFVVIGPCVELLSHLLTQGVNYTVQHNLLPLTSIFIEPAKIFFLNNAINHGILSPLGIQRTIENGQSIFFLIEANPGPGLGVLLAYMFFARGTAKQSAMGASVIHFLGGIHEIYFPYVLMDPRLLFALIGGGMTGIFTLSLCHAGLLSPPSPGSIFAVLLMTPRSSLLGVLASISCATLVSFLMAIPFVKQNRNSSLADKTHHVDDSVTRVPSIVQLDQQSPQQSCTPLKPVEIYKVIVACDAGMGSSAMGASILKKRVQQAGFAQVVVSHCAINSLPSDADIVITHRTLTQRARRRAPQAEHISLTNFMDSQVYADLIHRLQRVFQYPPRARDASAVLCETQPEGSLNLSPIERPASLFQLSDKDIFLKLSATNKEQVIRFVGEQLVKNGYVKPAYIEAMLARERVSSTYLGESIAVPHGTIEAKEEIIKTGLVVCQYPEGVLFGDRAEDKARLVIGIAARNNEHVQVIAKLTQTLDSPSIIEQLSTAEDIDRVLQLLSGEQAA